MCAKIVQVEDNKKEKPKFFRFFIVEAPPIFCKEVQVEDNKKEKTKFFHFFLLRRRLSSADSFVMGFTDPRFIIVLV